MMLPTQSAKKVYKTMGEQAMQETELILMVKG